MQTMTCVRRRGLASIKRAFSTIQPRPKKWSSASAEWAQNLDSTALKTFQNGKSSLCLHELILGHNFYSTNVSTTVQICQETKATSDEDENPELQDVNREEEEDNLPELNTTDEAAGKRKWKLVDARREICKVLEKGDEDMDETLTQLGILLNPLLINMVLEKARSPSLALRFFQWAKAQRGFKHNSSTYDKLVDILGRSKDFEALQRVLSERSTERCSYSTTTFSFATAWLDDSNMLNEFMGMIEKLEPSTRSSTHENLIAALCKENHVDAAMVVLKKMASADCAQRMSTFRPLILFYRQKNQMDKLQEVFELMKMKGCPPGEIPEETQAASSECENPDPNETKASLTDDENPELQAVNSQEEEDTFPELNKTDETPPKKKWKLADVISEIWEVLEKDDEDMEETLTQLGLRMNTRLVKLVLNTANSPSSALRFFQWAKLQPGFKHDTSTYDTLVNILGWSKDFETLQRVLSERADACCNNSSITFLFAAAWHDDLDMLKEVMDMFDKLKPSLRREAYEMLIAALCRENHVNAALAILEKMVIADCAPRLLTYRPLIQVYCQNNQMHKAQEVFEIMKDSPQDSICYNLVLTVLCDKKQFAEATKLLQSMVNTGCTLNAYTYNIMIRAACKAGKIQGALQLFDRMKEEGIKPMHLTYMNLLDGLFQIGGFDRAHSFLIQQCGKDRKLDSINYYYLIKICRKSSRLEDAHNLLMEMRAKGFGASA